MRHPSHRGPGSSPPASTHPEFLLPPFPSCAQVPYPKFLILVQAARLLWVKRA